MRIAPRQAPLVGIVDGGYGNLRSVAHAVEAVGGAPRMCREPADLDEAERLILPGVGAFRRGMEGLRANNLDDAVRQQVIKGKPLLGICLGMQLLATRGLEGGEETGLDLVPGEVRPFRFTGPPQRVPHVGWNDIQIRRKDPLFSGLRHHPPVYFVHSYVFDPTTDEDVMATCDHGGPFAAAVQHGNVAGVQFHPEKSQDVGLRILTNFMTWEG